MQLVERLTRAKYSGPCATLTIQFYKLNKRVGPNWSQKRAKPAISFRLTCGGQCLRHCALHLLPLRATPSNHFQRFCDILLGFAAVIISLHVSCSFFGILIISDATFPRNSFKLFLWRSLISSRTHARLFVADRIQRCCNIQLLQPV